MINLNETISKIEILKEKFDEQLVWGIRFDVANLPIGHIFRPSRVWFDNELTEEVLSGTSVLEDRHLIWLSMSSRNHVRHSIDNLYTGTPYIVCGYGGLGGEDAGEVILNECEIMATL